MKKEEETFPELVDKPKGIRLLKRFECKAQKNSKADA
ncbi:hypothetical protein DesfrDRAFT_3395 [Solidesulfovibrio fructosivorans JJ]]|uniref:Uncharacterized protein n=1 Tax=Solidesulfovibrio fructosivorans JJ] TaxID=596151 RepID=E1K0J5_SOLFR|nr:hypothetical protein DesfrDRAFT_3395 [Solidesulfovibrio fructosivorans JJ]]